MRSLAVSILAILLAATAAVAQTPPASQTETVQPPPFGEKVEVNAVLIDAIVTDRDGNQILGLEKDDFAATEDGARQALDSADYYTSRKLLNTKEENAPFKVEQVHEQRYIVFFFDKPEDNQLFSRVALARTGVNDFLNKQMTDADKVAIVGHDVRLKIYSDFTSDKVKLKKALDEVSRFSKGTTTPTTDPDTPSIFTHLDANRMMNKTGTVYQALTEIADALQPIRGRKNLILFSVGIHEPGEVVRGGVPLTESRYYTPMVEALNEANVSVYPMNLSPDAPSAPVYHQTLERVADETNGEYFRFPVTYTSPINQVAKISAGYYLLTYRTNKTGRGYQKVAVSVKNHPELRVTARTGYLYGY